VDVRATAAALVALSSSCLENTLLFELRRRELLYSLLSPLFEIELSAPAELVLPQTSALPHVSDLRAAIELLSKDLGSPLRVADLARAVNMSPSRFAHVFKEATGVSPHRFRKQLRLERAKFLLDVKGWSVTAVAAEFAGEVVARYLRPDVVERVAWHRTQGHELVIVSASFTSYLDPIAARLGFAAVLATELAVGDDGRLTGELVRPNVRGAEKVRRLDEWLGAGPAFVKEVRSLDQIVDETASYLHRAEGALAEPLRKEQIDELFRFYLKIP